VLSLACLQVFYLGYAGLKQVDLSDDQVVAAIATDDWENAMIPVEVGTSVTNSVVLQQAPASPAAAPHLGLLCMHMPDLC
jgi:hypothetical protein